MLFRSNKLILENIITNRNYILATLHLHDKRIPKNLLTLFNRVVRESNRKRNSFWRIGRFDNKVFFERVISNLNFRFRNHESDFRLR